MFESPWLVLTWLGQVVLWLARVQQGFHEWFSIISRYVKKFQIILLKAQLAFIINMYIMSYYSTVLHIIMINYINMKAMSVYKRLKITNDTYYLASSDSLNKQDNSISNCHNVFVNEDTGYLYAVGANQGTF